MLIEHNGYISSAECGFIQDIAEWLDSEEVPIGDFPGIKLGTDTAAIHHREVGIHCHSHSIRNQIAKGEITIRLINQWVPFDQGFGRLADNLCFDRLNKCCVFFHDGADFRVWRVIILEYSHDFCFLVEDIARSRVDFNINICNG